MARRQTMFRVKGVSTFIKALENFSDYSTADTSAALREAAEIIQKQAQHYAPRKSGTLEGAIKIEGTRKGRAYGRYEVYVDFDTKKVSGKGTISYYAKKWHRQEARQWGPGTLKKEGAGSRYMTRAFEETKPVVEALLTRTMAAAVRRANRSGGRR